MSKRILFAFFMLLVFMLFASCGEKQYDLPIDFTVVQKTDVFVHAEEEGKIVSEYPTIIRLQHQKNEQDNGKLLVAFEKWGSTYPVYESNDDAASWQYVCTVKDTLNENFWNEWMPFLYELPSDIGAFEKGTILLGGTSVYGEGVTDSTITLYASSDAGKTFTAFCNVDKAGGTDWGVWEPFLIYEEATGRLFCFYSDDSDPEHSQKLVYKYTTDLVSWSEKFECVACEDSNLRPGMVSLTKMGNGEYFMVYEMVGIDGNPIYCKTSTSLDDWGDVADYGQIVSADGKTFGSSPYVAWTAAGGDCGTLVVVGKHPIAGESKTGTDMFLSFDYGKTFIPVANPIPYSLNPYERCSYSPSWFFASDGTTLYYANNPPCYDESYKITVAKIKIAEKVD